MSTAPELPPPPAAAPPTLRLVPDPPALDFDAFVRHYEVRLRRLVMRRIGDMSDAEEITQETLLRAYQHSASFANEDELMAWSTVVAQRLVIDRVRVRGRSIAVGDVPEGSRMGRDTAEIVVAKHEARVALEALEAMPHRQAAVLWAREVEGLSYESIAQRFEISEPAVRSLLHRGRRTLREEFTARTGSLPLHGLIPFAPWLLALRAASKLRRSMRSLAGSPAGAVAALSFAGIAALSIGSGMFGAGPSGPSIRQVPHARTETSTVAMSSVGAAGSSADRASASMVGDTRMFGVVPATCSSDVANTPERACVRSGEHQGVTIVVEALPDNRTGVRGVVLSNTAVKECPPLPGNPVAWCEQRQGTSKNDSSQSLTPSTEGGLR